MTAGGKRLDSSRPTPAPTRSRLRPGEPMDSRPIGVNDDGDAKDQLCAPRVFTFGHVRQLEAVVGKVLARAWQLGAGPGSARLVIDVDSTICAVEGRQKQGAAYGYTKVLGYHPILASRADTGEIIHARMRKGSANTSRGARRFIDETVARLRRAGAAGEIVMRFDSGFWAKDTLAVLAWHRVRYTMAVRTNTKGVWPRLSPLSTRTPGSRSNTPPTASPRWPRPPTAAGG
jgi:Transposase DDE domain group 1